MCVRDDGLLLYREGHYSEALAAFIGKEIDPAEDTDLAYFMGLCYVRLQENMEAIRLFKQVLKQEDKWVRIYQVRMILAWLLACKNDVDVAIEYLQAILDDGVLSPQAWSILGYCQWCRGDEDSAIESYTKAVGIDMQNANAINGLGYILADTGKDSKTAVSLCRRAVEENPKSWAYKDSLGWALFHAGDISEAKEYLAEALTACPHDKVIAEHLRRVRLYEQGIPNGDL